MIHFRSIHWWQQTIWKVPVGIIAAWAITDVAIDVICAYAHEYYEAALAIQSDISWFVSIWAILLLILARDVGCLTLPLLLTATAFAAAQGNAPGTGGDYEIYSIGMTIFYASLFALAGYIAWLVTRSRSRQ